MAYFLGIDNRFPRPSRLASFSVKPRLLVRQIASETIPSEAFADDLRCGQFEAVEIIQLAIVVAIALLVQIPEQVKRLHANVGAVQTAFQKAPEVL